jgi:arabinan endo-1,5-alpha-L-arabinosidase
LSTGLIACGGGSGGGGTPPPPPPAGTAPSISGFEVSKSSAIQNEGGGLIEIRLGVDFSDADGDVSLIETNWIDSSGSVVSVDEIPVAGLNGETSGVAQATVQISTTSVDNYTLRVRLTDQSNRSSNRLDRQIQIMSGTDRFHDVSVHDPAIIRVNDDYYVFGSHLAAAKTSDFMQWQWVTDGVHAANILFDNVVEELAEIFAWSDSVGLWANDVIQLENGLFCMYPNLSRDDSPRGSLALATANQVEGPYVSQGILLQSGMWGQVSEDGVNLYDPQIHPNTVDPDAFHDEQGNLRMIYGSFSGGIFILQMDLETCLPLAGQGYGTRLMGGNHARIEGPNVLYSPHSGYYYMFVSFGGLRANGGYNLRVARSPDPDGPYLDALGNDMADVQADPSLPLFDDVSIEPYAQKLMGSHLFQREIGEPGSGIGTGYLSPGHNSAYYDENTGRYFLIFHTRFPLRGELFQVRVHEMFINADGWPVVAPHRYVTQQTNRPETTGDYKLINHGKAISPDIRTSQFFSLLANGSIAGEMSGQWDQSGANFITLDIDGIGSFRGVLSMGWNEAAEASVLTFSATSDEGVSIWGTRLEDKSAAAVLSDIHDDLSLGVSSEITHDLVLPAVATRLASISWSSSDPAYLADDGSIIRPEPGEGDKPVTLTATITYAGQSTSKSFDLVVKERSLDNLLAHYAFENDLTDSTEQRASGVVSGSLIGSAGGNIGYDPGVIGNAAAFDGATGIRLPDGLINDNTYTVSLWVYPDVITPDTTTFFGGMNPNQWVSVVPSGNDFVGGGTVVWSGSDWYYASTSMNINAEEWSHIAFTVNDGEINVYVNGVLRFSDAGFPDLFAGPTGIFSIGANWWDPSFQGLMDEVQIFSEALPAAHIRALSVP